MEGWIESLRGQAAFTWGNCRTEAGRTVLVWRLMQRIADDDTSEETHKVFPYAESIRSNGNLDDRCRELAVHVFRRLFDYLIARVETHESALYLLARYAARVEWFDQERLYERYQADTRQGEAVYDADLRHFLFDQGLDMPFSQAKSASGLSDVLAALQTADPLVAEVKVFDGKDRGKRHLASGVTQVSAYAEDYDKNVGYLVIANLAEQPLALPSDGPRDRPPYLDVAGVRVYLIPVRALPTVSASKRGRTRPIEIIRADLVEADRT